MSESIKVQIARDLQRKLSDDIFNAIKRTTELAPDSHLRVLLGLQAACSAISALAQMLDECTGETRSQPSPLTVMLACQMCARSYDARIDSSLADIMKAADHDLTAMTAAGISIKGRTR